MVCQAQTDAVFLFTFLTTSLIVMFVYFTHFILHKDITQLHFYVFKYESLMHVSRVIELFYIIYLYICYYSFPSLLYCISICFTKSTDECLRELNELHSCGAKLDPNIFGAFSKKFHESIKLVEKVNGTFTVNIGMHILLLINSVIARIYTLVLFKNCSPDTIYGLLVCDSIAVGLMFLAASNINSEVSLHFQSSFWCLCCFTYIEETSHFS